MQKEPTLNSPVGLAFRVNQFPSWFLAWRCVLPLRDLVTTHHMHITMFTDVRGLVLGLYRGFAKLEVLSWGSPIEEDYRIWGLY